ncbi:MAG: amidohydrolase [Ndongobacter sp.]|nr:amidohydrolase [Ndongobacter sp.]
MAKTDFVLFSECVYSGEGDQPFAGGVAVSGNRIAAVGPRREIEAWIDSETIVRDVGKSMIMPGLCDAHGHFAMGALNASRYFLRDIAESSSEEECVEMVRKFAQAHPELDCIVGQGWFLANWNNAPLPTKASLDRVISDRPVYLGAADAHTGWVNSKALEELRRDRGFDPNDPVYGTNVVKLENGEPSGILREEAWFRFGAEKVFQPGPDIDEEVERELLQGLARRGITTFCDMSGILQGVNYDAMERIEQSGDLIVRINLNPALRRDPDQKEFRELRERFHSDKLCVTGVKGVLDGVTSTHTGYTLEPYTDRPDCRGLLTDERAFFMDSIRMANANGIGVRLHCIADGAVRLALDCFENSGRHHDLSNLRNTIEHIENIHPDDIPRFRQLGVVPSMQPRHLPLEDNEKIVRMGKERCRWEWPFRSLIDAGAIMAFGTDFPVVDYNPFETIYYAVTRRGYDGKPTGVNPEEAVTLAETLRAYTFGGAYASHREHELGTLKEGMLADIVVLDRNLFAVSAEDIPTAQVLMTMMDGKVVYEALP